MRHVAFVFYASDYVDASDRRAAGLADRYRHHSYSLDSMERLTSEGSRVSVVRMHGQETFDLTRPGGLRLVGLGASDAVQGAARLSSFIAGSQVTHVVILFPSYEVIEAAIGAGMKVAVVLADSFPQSIRARSRYATLGRLLRDDGVELVANHQLNSARQVARRLDLDPRTVIPWDWPLDLESTAATSAKHHRGGSEIRLCYAGSITRIKGVWDVLDAMTLLRFRGLRASLELAGAGDLDELHRRVRRRRLEGRVEHLGVVGGDEVLAMMQRSDFVAVPSRHSYPEGRPLTIYEGMASGTPLVASDHPMFRGVVRDSETGFVFRGGRPTALAATIARAWRDPKLYAHVSCSAAKAYPSLGGQPLWGDLIIRWVRGAPTDQQWIVDRSLAARDSDGGS